MKNVKAIVVFIFITSTSMAQFNIMLNDTFSLNGLGSYDFSGIQKDDSFYYYIGGVNNFENTWKTMITKMDYNGLIKKTRKVGDSLLNYADYPFNSFTINGDILLSCPQVVYPEKTLCKIIAFDKHSLDTLWSKTYAHPDTLAASQFGADVFSDLTSIKPIPGGGYIVTGNYNKNCITGNMRSFLMKIDSLGNVLWRKTYDDITLFMILQLIPTQVIYYPAPTKIQNHLRLLNLTRMVFLFGQQT